MTKEEIRDKLEDLYIKETGRFAFLMPNEIDIRYVEWLESQLLSKLNQSTIISEVCKHTKGSCKIIDNKHTMKCIDCGEVIWEKEVNEGFSGLKKDCTNNSFYCFDKVYNEKERCIKQCDDCISNI